MSNRIKIHPGFWTGLRQLGIPASEVARQAQLPLDIVTDSTVSAADYFAIWHSYAELVGDTADAIIKLATNFETAHYPPAALATFHARDYRDALMRMARYKQLCPPESLVISEHDETCTIQLDWWDAEQAGPTVLVGITLAYLLELGRRGTGQSLKALLVEFTNPMGDIAVLENYFGCAVRIGAGCNRLTLNRSDLDRPFVSYNEELLEILTPVLDQTLNEQQRSSSVTETVKWIMKRSFASGHINIQQIAGELKMSSRTLQRRLTDEGVSFKQLLMQARHELALIHLADPSLEIKEVAFLTGYEDQNSFYRAFRIWEGDTPSNWRARHARWREGLVTD
ncbi:AraC family transcriptional regulator [Paenibacillus cellulosilyticus]|uniref:AraC family transcriptional regulator n=1 Tax=Paenibacillus cellulosilyticus TaxID=375489 RepID=A0A2V2Z3A7_9BACL|nr:AraC family transcriptional regulator [Paenibacillus cellulosilyticus]PWW08746.1 AraC family transcriptional regulator [Paenibacillus cellulosilyticus]QKS48307.1 AraC family transcriptional regulator ligand-binding domain-containing protein [Paenibacillus cellulosilyticus]